MKLMQNVIDIAPIQIEIAEQVWNDNICRIRCHGEALSNKFQVIRLEGLWQIIYRWCSKPNSNRHKQLMKQTMCVLNNLFWWLVKIVLNYNLEFNYPPKSKSKNIFPTQPSYDLLTTNESNYFITIHFFLSDHFFSQTHHLLI